MKINSVLKQEGLAMSEPKKWHRKKWIRYEREHSNSLWHVDRHKIKDPRKGLWLIVYEDYSSKYSVDVLKKAISMYGKPEEILSDHGTTFYALESDKREKRLTDFEKLLIKGDEDYAAGQDS